MKPTILLISCEHGSNKVPKKYAPLFQTKELVLKTPHGYDLGASHIVKHLHKALDCDLVQTKVTRLLIDSNHGPHHARCFSKFSKKLSTVEKNKLIKTYYEPFHHELQEKIATHIAQGQQVLHLSLYTFTPILKGLFLNTGIGLLYNAHRHAEKEVARIIHGLLQHSTPAYKVRHNYPFLGTNDFVLNTFRNQFSEKEYLGIKLGINQVLISNSHELHNVCDVLEHALRELLVLL